MIASQQLASSSAATTPISFETNQAVWLYGGNHGSIRGSWPSAFSGCPKGHRDFTEAKCQRHFGRLQAIRMLTLEPERLKNQRTTTRRRSPEMEGALQRRRSSGLRLQFRNVEILTLLPSSQRNGCILACQREACHGGLHTFGQRSLVKILD